MSSWVAPAVAAEMWGCSVDQVVAAAAEGTIASQWDGDFLFVAAEPASGLPGKRPATFRVRDAEDDSHLHLGSPDDAVVTQAEMAALGREESEESEEDGEIEDEGGGPDLKQWRSMRAASFAGCSSGA